MEFKSEKEFLESYNPLDYDSISVTTDILVFSISDEIQSNYRKLNEKKFSILLVKRDNYPFKDKWCLPGGFVKPDEDLDHCASRILKNESNLDNIYLEQLYTFSNPKRDPRMRVISTSYMALTDKNKLGCKLNPNASWFNVSVISDNGIFDVVLDNGTDVIKYRLKKVIKNSTTNQFDYVIVDNDMLAFDHPIVINTGIDRLKNKIEYTDIVFNLMPRYFTLGELQQVYELVLGKKLLDPAFRRIIADKVVKTDKVQTGGGHRPSVLFEYRGKI